MTTDDRHAIVLVHAYNCARAYQNDEARPAYPGPSLQDMDLRGLDLSGINLSRADLRGAILCGVRLYGANLSRADLGGADLRDADARDVDLRGANLAGARLEGIRLDLADVRWIDPAALRDADVRGAIVSRDEVRWQGLVDQLRAEVFTARLAESQAQATAAELLERAGAAEAAIGRGATGEEAVRACPFCGHEGKQYRGGADELLAECPKCDVAWLHPDDWNKRPIEDALRGEGDALRAERDAIKVTARRWEQMARRTVGGVVEAVKVLEGLRWGDERLAALLSEEAVAAKANDEAACRVTGSSAEWDTE